MRDWDNFFTAEDGKHVATYKSPEPGYPVKSEFWISIEEANTILREEIAKAKRVYAHRSSIEYGPWYDLAEEEPGATHSALLIDEKKL